MTEGTGWSKRALYINLSPTEFVICSYRRYSANVSYAVVLYTHINAS